MLKIKGNDKSYFTSVPIIGVICYLARELYELVSNIYQ